MVAGRSSWQVLTCADSALQTFLDGVSAWLWWGAGVTSAQPQYARLLFCGTGGRVRLDHA